MTDSAINITENDVSEFTRLCAERGLQIDSSLATTRLYALVRAMELAYSPVSKADVEQIKNDDGNEEYAETKQVKKLL